MSKTKQPKKQPSSDWHRADIVAALHKRGTTLRKLAKLHEYASPTTLGQALNRPWPKGEKIIADAIGVHPSIIWPSRYPDAAAYQCNTRAA